MGLGLMTGSTKRSSDLLSRALSRRAMHRTGRASALSAL